MQFYDKNDLRVKKKDVSIAKNYLSEDEIKLLGLLVEQYYSDERPGTANPRRKNQP